jgi:hypothetical protein
VWRIAKVRVTLRSMGFTWPDPISFVADVIAIIGIPTLAVANWQL